MAKPAVIEELARQGRLYPSVILHGARPQDRMEVALRLSRILLCERPERPVEGCECRHCPRIRWPRQDSSFHPDFCVLERDLRTATSADSTRELLRNAQLSPFEARGQVFVVERAETLTDEAASALLKILEEPPLSAPRNFLLLCPNPQALLETIRSRSISFYLGSPVEPDSESLRDLAKHVAELLESYSRTGSPAYLLAASQVLFDSEQWDDPRSAEPWANVAAALLDAYRGGRLAANIRQSVLDLAADLLDRAPQIRVRSIPAQRILDGLVAQHLGSSSGNAV